MAECDQRRVDAVLQRRAMLDQVQPPSGDLALAAQLGVGSQIAGTRSRNDSSASTRASILSVLHASGASPLTRCASAISTSQPYLHELVVHEASAVHRLHHAPHRLVIDRDASRQPVQAVAVRRRREVIDQLAMIGDQADVNPPATQSKPTCNIEDGPPLSSLLGDSRSVSPEEALLHGSPKRERPPLAAPAGSIWTQAGPRCMIGADGGPGAGRPAARGGARDRRRGLGDGASVSRACARGKATAPTR